MPSQSIVRTYRRVMLRPVATRRPSCEPVSIRLGDTDVGEALLAAVVSVVDDDVGLVVVLGVTPDLVAAVDACGDEASIG